jgi:PAS domain S-box-containing protein
METENLKLSEFKISAFFDLTPDLVCIAGRDGYFKKVNRAVIEKLKYTEEELMTKPISFFMHAEDRELTLHRRSELLKGKSLINFQNRYMTKTGAILWLEWTSIYFSDDEVVFAIAKDITARKQIEIGIEEKYRKFKSLTSHFKSSMEEDRKYLANELHDELATLASVLKTDIDWLKKGEFELPPTSQARVEHASVVSQLLIKTIRRLSFYISPNMLEHLGLEATLEWHCREFSILNGIPCSFKSLYNGTDLTDEVRVDLFRICQEALMNTLNHAQASQVSVTIADIGDHIQLTVSDDGRGFEVGKQKQMSGLIRMRERAASINGELTIQSEVGKGTSICVSIVKQQ